MNVIDPCIKMRLRVGVSASSTLEFRCMFIFAHLPTTYSRVYALACVTKGPTFGFPNIAPLHGPSFLNKCSMQHTIESHSGRLLDPVSVALGEMKKRGQLAGFFKYHDHRFRKIAGADYFSECHANGNCMKPGFDDIFVNIQGNGISIEYPRNVLLKTKFDAWFRKEFPIPSRFERGKRTHAKINAGDTAAKAIAALSDTTHMKHTTHAGPDAANCKDSIRNYKDLDVVIPLMDPKDPALKRLLRSFEQHGLLAAVGSVYVIVDEQSDINELEDMFTGLRAILMDDIKPPFDLPKGIENNPTPAWKTLYLAPYIDGLADNFLLCPDDIILNKRYSPKIWFDAVKKLPYGHSFGSANTGQC